MPPSSVIRDIVVSGLSLCIAAWGWVLLTRWGNSESTFFGVRVDNKFEDGADAGEIDSRYLQEIIALTSVLVLFNTLLQLFFRQSSFSVRSYSFWPLELLQAFGVRVAYGRAHNQTLPFAAPEDSVRTADLASLTPPSRAWNIFYWPSVYLPLAALALLALYLRSHWADVAFPYAISFPITVSSPLIAWSPGIILRLYWPLVIGGL